MYEACNTNNHTEKKPASKNLIIINIPLVKTFPAAKIYHIYVSNCTLVSYVVSK